MNQDERRIVEGGDSPQQRKAGDGAKRAILALAGGAGLFVLGSIAFDLGILGERRSRPGLEVVVLLTLRREAGEDLFGLPHQQYPLPGLKFHVS